MHKDTVDLGCMQWLIHQCHPGAPSSVHMLASSGNTLKLSPRCSFLFHVSVYLIQNNEFIIHAVRIFIVFQHNAHISVQLSH